jgi:hypothetical protein
MNDDIEDQLAQIVSGKSNDLEWAKETYRDKLSNLKDRVNGSVEGDKLTQIQNHAVRMVKSEVNQGSRVGGDVEKVDVVAIGHGGIREWSSDDGGTREVLLTYGVVKPEDKPMGMGVFINDETTGVDIHNIQSKFRTLNEIEAYYTVGEEDDLPHTYVLNSAEETRVEVKDEEDMADEDARRNLLHQHTDEAELANVKDYLSAMDSQGRTVAFGADVKRMNATVVDAVSLENTGIYTILDDSVIDPEELSEDVRDDRAQTPGMTAWCPNDYLKYGVNSQIEVYGSITTMDDGQVCMNIYGIVPLITFEMEEDGGDSGGDVDVSDI